MEFLQPGIRLNLNALIEALFNYATFFFIKLSPPFGIPAWKEAGEQHHLGTKVDKGRFGDEMDQMAPRTNKSAKPLLGIPPRPKCVKP